MVLHFKIAVTVAEKKFTAKDRFLKIVFSKTGRKCSATEHQRPSANPLTAEYERING
jgi:hypothetical protein